MSAQKKSEEFYKKLKSKVSYISVEIFLNLLNFNQILLISNRITKDFY